MISFSFNGIPMGLCSHKNHWTVNFTRNVKDFSINHVKRNWEWWNKKRRCIGFLVLFSERCEMVWKMSVDSSKNRSWKREVSKGIGLQPKDIESNFNFIRRFILLVYVNTCLQWRNNKWTAELFRRRKCEQMKIKCVYKSHKTRSKPWSYRCNTLYKSKNFAIHALLFV